MSTRTIQVNDAHRVTAVIDASASADDTPNRAILTIVGSKPMIMDRLGDKLRARSSVKLYINGIVEMKSGRNDHGDQVITVTYSLSPLGQQYTEEFLDAMSTLVAKAIDRVHSPKKHRRRQRKTKVGYLNVPATARS